MPGQVLVEQKITSDMKERYFGLDLGAETFSDNDTVKTHNRINIYRVCLRLCLRRVKILCYRGQLHPQDVVVDGCLILPVKYLQGKGVWLLNA